MRTTFRRQVMIVLCLLLVATMLLGVSFWLVFEHYATEKQTESMRTTARSVSNLVQAYEDSYLYDWDFRTNLSIASTASENDVLILSADGEVQMCAQELQNCSHIGKRLNQKAVSSASSAEAKLVSVSTIYPDERIAVGLPVQDQNGELMCIVLVSVERAELQALTGRTLRIFFMTALIVIALMIVAIPFLTRRETKPIQTMAAAARQIAHGNLDVRVPTGNRTEEVEELAIAFNNMAAALQNSETVRQEFVANVSHELKTPMTTIAGYLDGMLDGTIPSEKHQEYMELVASEARRLSRMVRNMLDASRLRDQGIPMEQRKTFDICETVGQALLSFEQRINRKLLDVQVDMPEAGMTVCAQEDSITQVLYNLMDNAVKFVDDGGTLSIRVRRHGDRAAVTIGNTGTTIAPEELPLIFDRFHKTDKSRSTDRDGVGLGLYIVKTIIMAHGEDIYVTSRDGETRFTFTLSLSK